MAVVTPRAGVSFFRCGHQRSKAAQLPRAQTQSWHDVTAIASWETRQVTRLGQIQVRGGWGTDPTPGWAKPLNIAAISATHHGAVG